MSLSNALLQSVLALATVAADAAAQDGARPANRVDQLSQLSQRLIAGDASAIEDLLACTKPSSPTASGQAPSSAEIQRLRVEVERLRGARPMPTPVTAKAVTAASEPHSATARDAAMALREARAWLRAGDPNKSLKALPADSRTAPSKGGKELEAGEVEALYRKACALERIGRDDEALDSYRRVVAGTSSPLMKQSAASGVDHIEWRMRHSPTSPSAPEAKP